MRLWGVLSPKRSPWLWADSVAASVPRGNSACSYSVSAASASSGCAAMALPSSAPSYMARLAPSPFGAERWAASPSRVTPGTRSQRCPMGRALRVRRTGAVSPSVISAVSSDSAAATARIAAEFDGWAPELTGLVTDGETAPVLRTLNALPIGHRWDRVPGVTLLGDAAHLSAPNGEGANLAMYDGAELGKAIAAHPDDAEVALTDYEQAMFVRIVAANAEVPDLYLMLGDGTPHTLINTFTGG